MTKADSKCTTAPPQAKSYPVTTATIMRDPAFSRGFKDQRAGINPDYDTTHIGDKDIKWGYERGRQLAIAAPADMALTLPRSKKLNPKALELYDILADAGVIV